MLFRSYAGSATIQVPDDLREALDASPTADAAFAGLDATNRYAVLHRIVTAPNEVTRERRLAKVVAMLAEGDVPHPG